MEGWLWYDVQAGEATIDDISIGRPGAAYALSARWGDLTGLSDDFAIVEDYDAIRVSKRGARSVGFLISGGDTVDMVLRDRSPVGERRRGAGVSVVGRPGITREVAGGLDRRSRSGSHLARGRSGGRAL